jgi:hypothetical protein
VEDIRTGGESIFFFQFFKKLNDEGVKTSGASYL